MRDSKQTGSISDLEIAQQQLLGVHSTAMSESKNNYRAPSRDSHTERTKMTNRGMLPQTSRIQQPE